MSNKAAKKVARSTNRAPLFYAESNIKRVTVGVIQCCSFFFVLFHVSTGIYQGRNTQAGTCSRYYAEWLDHHKQESVYLQFK